MKNINKSLEVLLLISLSFLVYACSGDLPDDVITDDIGQPMNQVVRKTAPPPQSLKSFFKCLDYYYKLGAVFEGKEKVQTLPYEWREYFEISLRPILLEAQKTNIFELNAIYKGLGTEFYTKLIVGLKMILSSTEHIKSDIEKVNDVTENGFFNTLIYALNEKKFDKQNIGLYDKGRILSKRWFDWLMEDIDKINKTLQEKYEAEGILEIVHSSTFYNVLGGYHLDKKDYEPAILAFNKAIKADPENDLAYQNRGNAYYLKNEFKRAVADYSRSIKLNPKNDSAYLNLARIHSLEKNIDKAIENIKKCLQLNQIYLKQIKTDPDFDNLRKDARYQSLLKEYEQNRGKQK